MKGLKNAPKPSTVGHDKNPQLYSDNPDNIGNLSLGDIDVIITSPPYESALEGTSRHTRGGIASRDPALAQTETYSTVLSVKQGVPVMYSPNPDNIGNLRSKDEEYKMLEHEKENYINPEVDVIITSPPYAHESTASEPTKLELEGKFKMGHSKEVSYTDDDYRSWDKRFGGNIGKLKMFVRVPASPEEADHVDNRPERKGTLWEYTKEVLVTPENVTEIQGRKRLDRGRGETYVEAMMKVYNEMYKVLKPNGYAIVIIKPFIRNKQVIDLPYYTWLMMKKAGFRLEKIYKLRLETQSFWRILYYKKHPDVPRINHEYIIVCRK
jgi:DNA modification methylase